MIENKILGGSQRSEIDHNDARGLNKEKDPGNFGIWNQHEQQKYINFLQTNRKIFQNPHRRKETKIFKLMSQFIQTRTGIQCRSHHMKQMRTHRNKVRNIISSYKKIHMFEIPEQPEKMTRRATIFQNRDANQKNEKSEQIVKLEERQEQKKLPSRQGSNSVSLFRPECLPYFYGQPFLLFDRTQQDFCYQPMIFYLQ